MLLGGMPLLATKRVARSTILPHASSAGSPPTAQEQIVPAAKDNGEDDNCCPICHDHNKLHPVVVTGCKHEFHRKCLEKWCKACDRQRRSFICPVCRTRLLPDSFQINDEPDSDRPGRGRNNDTGFVDEFGDDFDARWNSSDFLVMDTYMPGRPGIYNGVGLPDYRRSRPAEIDSAGSSVYMPRRHAGQFTRYTAFGFGPMALAEGYQSEQLLFSPRVHRRL